MLWYVCKALNKYVQITLCLQSVVSVSQPWCTWSQSRCFVVTEQILFKLFTQVNLTLVSFLRPLENLVMGDWNLKCICHSVLSIWFGNFFLLIRCPKLSLQCTFAVNLTPPLLFCSRPFKMVISGTSVFFLCGVNYVLTCKLFCLGFVLYPWVAFWICLVNFHLHVLQLDTCLLPVC